MLIENLRSDRRNTLLQKARIAKYRFDRSPQDPEDVTKTLNDLADSAIDLKYHEQLGAESDRFDRTLTTEFDKDTRQDILDEERVRIRRTYRVFVQFRLPFATLFPRASTAVMVAASIPFP